MLYGGYAGLLLAGGILGTPVHATFLSRAVIVFGMARSGSPPVGDDRSRLGAPVVRTAGIGQEEGRDPVEKPSEVPAPGMARDTGFEPVAFGSGVGFTKRAGPSSASQPLAIARFARSRSSTRLSHFASFSSPFGTPVVRPDGPVSARYLSVREYARVLGVSRATVYRAVASGDIPHVRVSNAIRIVAATDPSQT